MKRGAIKFCFKAGLSATVPLVLVKRAYGKEALYRSKPFRWYSWFRDGRELIEDGERGGRPKSTRNEVNIVAVVDLVKNDRRIASRMIAESLNIPRICRPFDSDGGFGKEKVVYTFYSTLLDTWAKRRSSHILPSNYRNGRCRQKFFNKIVTGDETWCFACDHETKRQSSEWVGETSPWPKKLKFQRSHIKTISIFFLSQGVVHKEFVPEGKTVKA